MNFTKQSEASLAGFGQVWSSRQSRADFLARASLGLAAVMVGVENGLSAEPSASPLQAPRGKGKPESKVKRWDVVTIGNLSRNRYWGESDAKGVRSAICTCTLIQGEGFRLLVDPSLSNAEEMAKELDRRTGLKLRDIDTIFITHEHGDHYAGLAHFSDAKWLAGPEVATILNQSRKFPKTVQATSGQIAGAIDIVPTPGHTLSHRSLRFDCDGLSVAVTGDAVPTRDFWRERRGYFNCVDFELSAKSMDKLAALADVIVPGHDNSFLELRRL